MAVHIVYAYGRRHSGGILDDAHRHTLGMMHLNLPAYLAVT